MPGGTTISVSRVTVLVGAVLVALCLSGSVAGVASAVGPSIETRVDGAAWRAQVLFEAVDPAMPGYGSISVVAKRYSTGSRPHRLLDRQVIELGAGFRRPLLVARARLLRSRRQLFIRFRHNRETAAVFDLSDTGPKLLYHTYGPQQVRLRCGKGRGYLLQIWPARTRRDRDGVSHRVGDAPARRRIYLTGQEDVAP